MHKCGRFEAGLKFSSWRRGGGGGGWGDAFLRPFKLLKLQCSFLFDNPHWSVQLSEKEVWIDEDRWWMKAWPFLICVTQSYLLILTHQLSCTLHHQNKVVSCVIKAKEILLASVKIRSNFTSSKGTKGHSSMFDSWRKEVCYNDVQHHRREWWVLAFNALYETQACCIQKRFLFFFNLWSV